ncbi:MAG TPA: nucleotide-binding protein [Nitrososphaeraceae archaeon]|nr:nucleotide-binding protein [Nitrososphaeraceae archaeon]
MSETKQNQQKNLSSREKFIQSANRGKLLANKCLRCAHIMLETIYYCEKCSGNKFDSVEYEGIGKTVTYTIQAVAPEGFEDTESYAWVVFGVDNAPFRASGFLPGVKSSKDLAIGEKVKVVGFNPNHGLILQKI